MFIIYNLVFLLFALINLPVYLFKGKFHKGFSARFGKLPKNLLLDRPIWVHAVSVGEAASVAGLITELRSLYPRKSFVITTITPTGNKIAKNLAKDADLVTYLPFDLSWIVGSVIDRINPSLFIIAETELWPNLIRCLYKKNIPMITVNGRISDKSFKGYLRASFLFKSTLEKIRMFCVQTDVDALRFKAIGVLANKIKVTGNMKFDIVPKVSSEPAGASRLLLGLKPEEKLLIAASTHPGEEKIILDCFVGISNAMPEVRLMIAPRHPERAHEIFGIIKKAGRESMRVSRIGIDALKPDSPVFILDTIGQLINFYHISDVVFVGGSLIKKGGHNILEPAALAKPIIFGPYMFNFRDITDLFLKHQAAVMVNDAQELQANIEFLFKDRQRSKELGEAAQKLIWQNQGATLRNAREIGLLLI
ncbi:MAG: 3-deoxy-D-manno-octulosonic acid transferase [Candidatus Omnitrophica bacterium]|nr:3-deoxy-D-manno-octulosonic acid transferase [Candidatus Omnitrophota bacterium]